MKKLTAIILAIAVLSGVTCYALSRTGSRGEEVTAIQNALKERGYYTGKCDGIFGTLTRDAVIRFQTDNGLVADGIAGEKTLAALGIKSGGNNQYDPTFLLLARLISAEARGESYIGQVAVGAVVLNRVKHPSFPDSIADVIYQRGAFSCLDDGQFYVDIADSAYSAARDALNGMDPTGGAIYYYNPKTATNKWIRSRPVNIVIGDHVFCA